MAKVSKVNLRNIMKIAKKLERGGYSKKRALEESWRIHKMQKNR